MSQLNTFNSPDSWSQLVLKTSLAIVLALVLGYIISQVQIVGVAGIIGVSIGALFLISIFKWPQISIYGVIIMGFLTPALSRFVPVAPFGLSIDIFLLMGVLVVFLTRFKDFSLGKGANDLSLVWLIWLVFVLLMIANPLARSVQAWFYAMRGIALYPMLQIPLMFLIMKRKKDMEYLFLVILLFEVVGSFWGIKQIFFGVSPTEQRWLDAGAASTHVLFGKLRAFSYFSDAAQFGASQIHIAFLAGVWSFAENKRSRKIFYGICFLILFYGFVLSGSRGPLVIPVVAGLVFLFLSKRFTLLSSGLIIGALVFSFLKFTTIGQTNYNIARLRTALNPTEDPSFLVRVERERILSGYLADKPLGGGIGSAGFWGKRFSPGTFLAEIGTDGHYTRIWMETGIIGLWLYLGIFAWIAFRLIFKAWFLKDEVLRLKVAGLAGSFLGLAVASYTNGLIVQIPTGPIVYCSMAWVYLASEWDSKPENATLIEENNPTKQA